MLSATCNATDVVRSPTTHNPTLHDVGGDRGCSTYGMAARECGGKSPRIALNSYSCACMRTSICCAWRVEMWLAPGWTSSAFAICTQCHPQLGPTGVLHGRAPHGVERHSKATSIYSGSSTSRRNSRANDELLAQTARSIGVRFQSHTADTAAPLVGTTPGALQRPGPGSSLTLAILESAVGDFSPRQLRDIADSPAYRDLEIRLLGNGDVRASRAEASLRELLEAITSVVGEGDGSRVAKVVAECPALLLCEGRELLATVQELRAMVRDVR